MLQAMQREAAGTSFEGRKLVVDDSLELAENQIGRVQRPRDFDWSGSTNYTELHRKVISSINSCTCARINFTDMPSARCLTISATAPAMIICGQLMNTVKMEDRHLRRARSRNEGAMLS